MKKKITISIDDELLKRIDEHSERHYISRTSSICSLIADALNNDERAYRICRTENGLEEALQQSNFI